MLVEKLLSDFMLHYELRLLSVAEGDYSGIYSTRYIFTDIFSHRQELYKKVGGFGGGPLSVFVCLEEIIFLIFLNFQIFWLVSDQTLEKFPKLAANWPKRN